MEKEFVPYELALRMKQLGFNKPCFGYWYSEQELKKIDIQLATIYFLEGEEDYILALTWQQAFRWFREKHDLFYFIDFSGDGFCSGWEDLGNNQHGFENFKTYEKAELGCLEKLIEIVEQIKSE
jgi:hypothetical protein